MGKTMMMNINASLFDVLLVLGSAQSFSQLASLPFYYYGMVQSKKLEAII